MTISQFHHDNATFTRNMTSHGLIWVPKQNKGMQAKYKAQKRREAVERQLLNIDRGHTILRRDTVLGKKGDISIWPPAPIHLFDGHKRADKQ